MRGTLVHAVLERLYDLPAAGAPPPRRRELLLPQWRRLLEEEPAYAELFADDAERAAWLAQARGDAGAVLPLEDPRRLEPAERELYVEAVLDSGLMLRGYIDRLDVAPTGEVRVVDYKTGSAPGPGLRGQGAVPDEVLRAGAVAAARRGAPPAAADVPGAAARCCATRRTRPTCAPPSARSQALWQAIERALETGEWRARRSRLCDWCDHQALCPEFGGTPPPVPDRQPGDTLRSTAGPATDEI